MTDYEALKTAGHSPALLIARSVQRGDVHALAWMKVARAQVAVPVEPPTALSKPLAWR